MSEKRKKKKEKKEKLTWPRTEKKMGFVPAEYKLNEAPCESNVSREAGRPKKKKKLTTPGNCSQPSLKKKRENVVRHFGFEFIVYNSYIYIYIYIYINTKYLRWLQLLNLQDQSLDNKLHWVIIFMIIYLV